MADGRIVVNQFYTPVEGGPKVMFSIQRVCPYPKMMKEAKQSGEKLNDLIANRGFVLQEAITVERGAYLPGRVV